MAARLPELGDPEHFRVTKLFGSRGLSRLIVDLDYSRLDVCPVGTLGDRLVPFVELWFRDYEVPVENLIGGEGEGLRPLVARTCDAVLTIPLSGPVGALGAVGGLGGTTTTLRGSGRRGTATITATLAGTTTTARATVRFT